MKNGVSSSDTPFLTALYASLNSELDRSLRAPATAESTRSLKNIRNAVRANELDIALRCTDRAWRYLPEDAATFAPIYGRLLALEGSDYNAALQLLRCASDFSPDTDVAALTAVALLRLNRLADTRQQFETALTQYCVEAGGLLARAGGELMRHPGIDSAGWIGLGPHLQIVGQLGPNSQSNALEISVDGETPFTQILPAPGREGAQMFTLDSLQPVIGRRLDVSSRGKPLLGNGLLGEAGFSLDGRAEARGNRIVGWARIGWSPASPVQLRVEDKGGRFRETQTRNQARPSWRWPFAFDLRGQGLRGNHFRLSARMPDGQWQLLPDSPLLLEPALRLARQGPRPLSKWAAGPPPDRSRASAVKRAKITDVIIPVYRGRDETLACIESVLATIDASARLVIVDDASDDPILDDALNVLEAEGRIRLLRNAQNLGFVASANRGLRLHPAHDAVLLNSDTQVFDDWLPRLKAAAYSGPKVGTVTPLTNSGSIASYPMANGSPIDPQAAAAMHALASSTLAGTRIEIPVGVGFCLYLRRDCLRDVGELDTEVFGKGYGEESDFCLRARGRGWSHRLAADVFVYHAGGVSFAGRRKTLLDRSQRLLNLRHPGYDKFVASYLAQDPLRSVRRQLDEHRLLAVEGRFVLLVTLALPGGVDRFVNERCRQLRSQGLFPLILRPTSAANRRRCELWTDAMQLPNLQYEIPAQLPELMSVLGTLRLDAVEIQHFLHLDARVIDAVRALPVAYDVVIHDYSWICPRVTLIDGSGRYCGEPSVAACQICVRRNGSKLDEKISVPALRQRSAGWLRGARRVIAPSSDTAARMQRHFTGLSVDVRPHTENIVPPRATAPASPRKIFRVALIGAIGTHKGYRILLACARDAKARRLPIEFVVIGHTELDAPLLATGKVFVTGHYSESEAPHLIRRERPDIAMLPSVWPETWCYTLDYALGAGLPVVAFDIGAIAERLRAANFGHLLPMSLSAAQINERLLELGERMRRADLTEPDFFLTKPDFFPTLVPSAPDDATMPANQAGGTLMMKLPNGAKFAHGARALNGAKSSIGAKSASAKSSISAKPAGAAKSAADASPHMTHDDGLSASVQVLPLPAGLFLFSVKSAAAPVPHTGGQLSLPAMHVGLGPGVRSDQVEFIAGPSTHGAWLFSTGDLLVTKISGAGVTLVLTSVRAPGGDVLSISVERLDGRADARAAATPLAPAAAAAQKGPGPAKESGKAVFKADDKLPLPVDIGAHIRTRGDMTFSNVPWAGRVAPGLWIESFSVRPLAHFGANDIEYKGLTGSGFETPWLSDNKMCGTKGMATPLVGFAIRLKPSPAAAAYDCEYSGYFQSGQVVGPLRNGAPCRSNVANDSLEGIQVRLIKRSGAALPEAARKANTPPVERAARREPTRRP